MSCAGTHAAGLSLSSGPSQSGFCVSLPADQGAFWEAHVCAALTLRRRSNMLARHSGRRGSRDRENALYPTCYAHLKIYHAEEDMPDQTGNWVRSESEQLTACGRTSLVVATGGRPRLKEFDVAVPHEGHMLRKVGLQRVREGLGLQISCQGWGYHCEVSD